MGEEEKNKCAEVAPAKIMKTVVFNGVRIGEIEASEDRQIEAARGMALIQAMGLRGSPSEELVMFNHAVAFMSAAEQIRQSLKANNPHFAMGAAPFVVNATFAIEVYLKCLAKLHGEALSGHKLLKLFRALPEDVRSRIQVDYPKYASGLGVAVPLPVEDLLRSINNAFVAWRYSYEVPPSALFRIPDTLAFGEAIHRFGEELLHRQLKAKS